MKKLMIAAVAALPLVSTPVLAQSTKAIAQMVTGISPFKADEVEAGARVIAGHAGEKLPCCFPKEAISIQVRQALRFGTTGSILPSWRLNLKKPHLN